MTQNKYKVAIVSTSLGSGGAERFASLLSVILDKLNVEVHNIIINAEVSYHYSGKLLNLGKQGKSRLSIIRKIKKGFVLNSYLKKNQIDLIIDNRSRNSIPRELVAKWIYGKKKTWYLVHSYNLPTYFPNSKCLCTYLYQNAARVIAVSQAIEEKIKIEYRLSNTMTISNPFDFSNIDLQNAAVFNGDYILYFGRFDEKVKNFTLMLEAFKASEIYLKRYKLILMGEGSDLDFIKDKLAELSINEYVKIIPFDANPFGYVKHAKFTILTSRYEGFPLSIVESLAIGTPVLSVDCKSGPNELIVNGYNGLLVPNMDINALSIGFQKLVSDASLYDICKKNASQSVEHLSLETISKQWASLLKLPNDNYY